MPELSIIIPVYNVEQFINRCIDSVLSQTYEDYEIILVNDGSTDRSGLICDEYAINNPKIKVLHKENGGLSDARNAGLKMANSEYVGFVDSDDYIERDMYEKLISACKKHKADIGVCGRFKVYDDKKVTVFTFNETKLWNSKETISRLLVWDGIDSSACDKVFKRELFRFKIFPIGRYNEDVSIMTSIIFDSKQVVHIGEPKYNYVYRENSITSEKFSVRKLDLLIATNEVMTFVMQHYPDLTDKAKSFHQRGLIYLMSLFTSKEDKVNNRDEYLSLRKDFHSNIYEIILNNHISLKTKIISILIFLNLFNFMKKLKYHLYKLINYRKSKENTG